MRTLFTKLSYTLIFLLYAATAFAAAPTVGAPFTTAITNTTALLNCYVDGKGELTTITFEYATNPNFIGKLQVSGGSTMGGTPASATITGLTTNQTYYWRVFVLNNTRGATSATASFVAVAPAVPVIRNLTTVSTTFNSATISSEVLGNSAITDVTFQYAVSPTALLNSPQEFITSTATTASYETKQVNLTNLVPNTTYSWRVKAVNSGGETISNTFTFNTPQNTSAPVISNVSLTELLATSAKILYRVENGVFTSKIWYGTNSGALNSSITATAGLATLNTNATLTGLASNTQYYYQVEVTNNVSTVRSPVNSFRTSNGTIIADFKFDNSVTNTANTLTFTGTGNMVYGLDRNFTTNGALLLSNGGKSVSISNLPIGNTARTISVWAKINTYTDNDYNYIFGYGINFTQRAYGLAVYKAGSTYGIHNFAVANDLSTTAGPFTTANDWHHYVTTFNGTTATLYMDGVAIATGNKSAWNTTSSNFVIGGNAYSGANFQGLIDDLSIYSSALTAQEVTNLYNSYVNTPNAVLPVITSVSAPEITLTSAKILYTVQNGSFTSKIWYGTDENTLTNSVNATAGTAILNTNITLTGLVAGTEYFYQVEVTNNVGTVRSPVQSVTTASTTSIAEFRFNGSPISTDNTLSFTGSGAMAYGTGRNLITNSALLLSNSGKSVIIPNLPTGKAARSVSIWAKINTYRDNDYNYIFSYGVNGANRGYGIAVNKAGTSYNFINLGGYSSDVSTTPAAFTTANDWHHYVSTFDGTTATLYRDGVPIATEDKSTWNTDPTRLVIGGNSWLGSNFQGLIDDLSIYNRALSPQEVTTLFNTVVSTANTLPPVITLVAATATTPTSAKISYKVENSSFTSKIWYSTNFNALNSSLTATAGTAPLYTDATLTGLTANTEYFYQVEVTNNVSTVRSAVQSFTTALVAPIAEFTFNNSATSSDNLLTFTGTGNMNYGVGRNSSSNGALLLSNGSKSVTIPNLPLGNASRTVSVWAKITAYKWNDYNFIFGYGTRNSDRAYGLSVYYATATDYYTFNNFVVGNDVSSLTGAFANANGWHHYVTSYNGETVSLYVDGILRARMNKYPWDTAAGDFFIGGNSWLDTNFQGLIDDLTIYNRALTDQEVTNLFNNNTVLPVSLVSYTAKAQNNNAVINWKTASETNNSHFVIAKSTDGTNFSELAKVNAKSANGADYTYTDNNTASGTNYYRLTQVDLDGKTTNLGVKAVNMSLATDEVKVYPNPATDVVNISFEAGIYAKATLLDINGKVISTSSIAKVQNIATIDLSKVAPGTYMVQLTGTNSKTIRKVIKK